MNKIVTINIGGIAIAIEEDAYDVLRDYLRNITNHFANTENGEEIVSDIELRIAEVLQGKLTVASKVSINIQDIKEVAEAMGYPSDFEKEVDEEPSENKENTDEQAGEKQQQTTSSKKRRRRLFRDTDDQRVGGVCSGLAQYFDVDVTTLRILWVVSVLVFGFGFWLYIILWAVLPEAKTTADKLEMKGEAPTIENIKNTIHKEATNAYNRIATPENKRSVRRFFERIFGFFARAFGSFFKLFALIIFVGIIILLVTLFMTFVFGGTSYGLNNMHVDDQMFEVIVGGQGSLIFKVAFYMIFAIPLVYIAMKILPEILSVPKPTKPVRQGVLSAWFLIIIIAVMGFFYSVYQFRDEGVSRSTKDLNIDSDTLVIKIDELMADEYIDAGQRMSLNVIQQNDEGVQLDIRKKARGRSEKAAKASLNDIVDSYRLKGNTLLMSEKVLLTESNKVMVPKMALTVRLPVGKSVIFHESTRRVIDNIENLQDIYDPRMAGHTFEMTYAGLKCTDCEDSKKETKTYKGNDDAGFNKVDVGGALKVEIIEGEAQQIIIPEEDGFDKLVKVDIRNNRLKIRQKSNGFKSYSSDKVIQVYLPYLKAIRAEGASKIVLKNSQASKEYFDVVVEGSSKTELGTIDASKMSVNIEGAGECNVNGAADLVILDMNGASKFKGSELQAQNLNIELDGASHAEIHVSDEISGQVDGVSVLTYKGSPKLKVEHQPASQVRQMD
ncbi:MAG: DUF2807 domain-containing protein [Bacteroidia bacterium]|nr:DUF2807 domain-containing protein [Bacteroidia bacterium]